MALLAGVVALLGGPGTAGAQDAGGDAATRLADRYAPVVVVRDQEAPCDRGGEPYRPVPVETVLGVPGIRLLDDDGSVVTTAPGVDDIAGRGPGTSLDFPGNPRRPGCRYEEDFRRLGAGRPDVAYAHVAGDASAPGRIALQYWFFWYFDDYVNTHEGDWEFVQLVFDAPTAEAALRTAPVEAGYSQHSGGERADWDGGKLERVGDHPVVYAAAGSHANFFTADLFLGRNADQGFGCDDTTGPSTRLPTQARLLPDDPDPAGPDAWLLFEGRWGEFQPSPYDAPPGPRTKDEWTEPIAWQDGLRDASFAVPTASTLGPAATGAFCAVVRAGGRVYTAVTSPLVLVLLVVGLVTAGGAAARATTWSPRPPRPLRRRRAAGQVLGAARGAYRAHTRAFLAVGVLFLPVAIIETAAQGAVFALTPFGSLSDVAGRSSLVSAALALLVAGAGHVFAAAVVIGGIAAVLDAGDDGRRIGVREAYALLRARFRALLATAVRATAVVLALGVTLVGIPWAIERLGRWAVALPASAIEGLKAGPALRRSAALTRGRWWRTTRLALAVNVVSLVSGPAVGIVLLFTTSLPLLTINAIASAVYVLTMPVAGAALALLYGDLVARERDGG